jgi:hypothetical protein
VRQILFILFVSAQRAHRQKDQIFAKHPRGSSLIQSQSGRAGALPK